MLPFTSTLARSALGAAALVMTTLVLAATAHAGSYSVYACWAGQHGNASWADVTDGVDDTTNGGSCNPSGNAPPFTSDYHGLQMRHGVSPYNQYAYRGAKLQISVPDGGMAITGIEADWRVYCGNTGWYPFAQTSGGYQFRNCGSWGFALSGWNRQGIGGLWDGSLVMGNICGSGAGCNRWVDPPSQLLAKNVRVDMYDPHMPSVPEAHGELWNGGIWHRGSRSLGWSAYDNIGVKRMEFWVQDGAWRKVAETATNEGCNYAYTRPCPQNKGWNVGQINTAQFSDGAHAVKLRVYDAADNMTDADATLHFDNNGPAKPAADLSASIKAAPNRGILDGQDTGWQITPAVALSWTNQNGGPSGVASNTIEVCKQDGTGCFTSMRSGADAFTNTVNAPARGLYKARVKTTDGAGNDSPWSEWVNFKYDDEAPGTAQLPRNTTVEHNGWINTTTATDFPQSVRMAAGQTIPAFAGIRGYSITVQKPGDPAANPDTDLADPQDVATLVSGPTGTLVIADVPEGKTIVKARAVSGSGRAAAAFDTIELKADRRAPDVAITPDVADETYVDGILHTVTGTDAEAPAPALADGKSGMEAGPSNEPVDHGGYVEISVDGAAAATTRGPLATSSSPNGTHTLAYSAVDQAGNRSTVKQLRFTVAGDQDGDSVPDPSDLCPTVAGPPPTGCPAGGPGGNGVGGSSDRAALSSPNGTSKNGDAALAGAKITDLYFVQKRKDEMLRQRRCVRAAGTSKAKRSRCKMGDLTKLTAVYGRRASIRGQLVDSKGDPVVGARIQVLESPKGRGIGQIDKGGVRTRADGTFRYTVAQNATSRSVQFVYKPYIGSDLTADKKKTELTIQAKVRASFSVRSGVIRFAGVALPGRQLVQIQGRPAGGKWETIKSVRSSSTGRFRGSYRLKQRTGRAIELRARLVTADRSVTVGTSRTVTRVAR
jgi:hypothetical protein